MEADSRGLQPADLLLDVLGEDGEVAGPGHRRVAWVRPRGRVDVLYELHSGPVQLHIGDEDLGRRGLLSGARSEQRRSQIGAPAVLAPAQPQAQQILVEVDRPVEVGDGEAEVMDTNDRHAGKCILPGASNYQSVTQRDERMRTASET